MEVLLSCYNKYVIESISNVFSSISDPISDKHWFLTPQQHAHEFIIMNAICMLLIIVGRSMVSNEKLGTLKKSKSSLTHGPAKSIVPTLLATVLIINVILNVIYKTIRGWRILFFMFQPCHVVSCIYAYCLLTDNIARGTQVFKLSIYYIFVTVAALIAPDLTDLQLPFEQHNFFIQHYALLISPFVLHIYKYNIEFQWSHALMSGGLIGLTHFSLFEILSFISGINLNYMLFPPPLGDFSYLAQESYRILTTVTLVNLSWFLGYLVVLISNALKPFILKSLTPIPSPKSKTN
ncbi:transmembrane protein [Tieghemostelium lacteum]|uniref:Transmembrane protein n=1 Tax=Tieghemostelium lacteum TaxID=361077 RepID=A0A152A5S1_TIELA|nr:transmembrane protein [Tieghemostelium lacteum]|eukprot:KYR01572.1 transmembrane protein [Tieghemostelium lacteum]